jgi:hypothetical protein
MPTPLPIIQGSPLTASVATYYTVPSTDPRIKAIKLKSLRFVNTDSTARTVSLYLVPKGASPTVGNTRFKDISIAAAGSEDSSAFFIMDDVMLQGTMIQAVASSAGVVAISATGETFP